MKFGRRKKPREIVPEKNNPNWHEHLCLMYRFGHKMFNEFCPHRKKLVWGPESGDDACDSCPYSITIDYDEKSKLVQIWGDVNVLHPDYDFTKNYI